MRQITRVLSEKMTRHDNIRQLIEILTQSIDWGRQHTPKRLVLKPDEGLTVYQNESRMVYRQNAEDRQFPLETVMLTAHNLNHDTDLSNAIVHTGPFADEFARSRNALAVTVAYHMFFRHGAYKPETEEGRKIIAHELTHIAQYEEGRITKTASLESLEQEAALGELYEEYDDDPLEEVEIGGEIFYLRPSEHAEVVADAVRMSKQWLREQKDILDTKEYHRLLSKFTEWKRRL